MLNSLPFSFVIYSWDYRSNAIIIRLACTRFYKHNFYKQRKLKLAKNRANANQHPEAQLFLFENDSHSPPKLSSKNNKTYTKKYAKEQM